MTKPENSITKSKFSILWRGIRGRCPQCGEGMLFKSYLKQNDACLVCNENLSEIRADDGPAWLTILLTGHIIAPIMVYFAIHDSLSEGMAVTVLLTIALSCALLILPRAKGVFIAAIWLTLKREYKSA